MKATTKKGKKTVKADNVHICRVTKDSKTPMQILQERRDRGAGVRKLFEGKSPFSGDAVECLVNDALSSYGNSKAVEKMLQCWSRGELGGYTHGNPVKLACQCAFYGIDADADFRAETVKNWEKSGYSVKPDARPLFIYQPLFDAERDAKKREEAEAAGEVVKIRRKYYRVAMLFALEDCEKERKVKRRVQKVKQETAAALDDFFGDSGEQMVMAL